MHLATCPSITAINKGSLKKETKRSEEANTKKMEYG